MGSWEHVPPLITAATPIILLLLGAVLRTADSRAKDKVPAGPVVLDAGADVKVSPEVEALRKDIEQESKIARLEERVSSLQAEVGRLEAAVKRRDGKIAARDETIRLLRGERP